MVRPRPLFPLLTGTLLEHLLGMLRDLGVNRAIVCANGKARVLREHFRERGYADISLEYYDDQLPRGPGGCIRDVAGFVRGGTFLVLEAGLFLEGDVAALVEEHRKRGSALTLAAVPVHEWAGGDGTVSTDAPLSPLGVYVAEPEILDHIPPQGYCDIKEQLIPGLSKMGLATSHARYRGRHRRISDARSYAALIQEMLSGAIGSEHTTSLTQTAPLVWVDESACIDPSAMLIGPIVVRASAVVGREAVLTGPTLVCDDVVIAERAFVSGSILWPGSSIGSGATVEHTIVTDSFRVQDGARLQHCVAVEREMGLGEVHGLRLGGFGVDTVRRASMLGQPNGSILPRLAMLWRSLKAMRHGSGASAPQPATGAATPTPPHR